MNSINNNVNIILKLYSLFKFYYLLAINIFEFITLYYKLIIYKYSLENFKILTIQNRYIF